VERLPQLGDEAVSFYRRQSNGETISEVLWRQDAHQLELKFTAPGADRLADLDGIAWTIYSNHPH
jgi:hypothetical protein